MPLNTAQVLAAAWFVGLVIAASLGLGEPLSPGRWPGIACNWFEIFMVERTVLFYVRVDDFLVGGCSRQHVVRRDHKFPPSTKKRWPVTGS